MILAGPTISGKSTRMKLLLLSDLITPPPNRISWLYTRWQPLYDEPKDRVPRLEFIHWFPDDLNSDTLLNPKERTFVTIDEDAMEKKDVCELFVEGAHHRNLSKACIMQFANLFNKGKENNHELKQSVSGPLQESTQSTADCDSGPPNVPGAFRKVTRRLSESNRSTTLVTHRRFKTTNTWCTASPSQY